MESNSKTITVIAPLYVVQSYKTKKDKKYHINLNQYRNWHYIISNNIKKAYKEIIVPQILGHKFNKVKIELTFYKGRNGKIDRANVLCIHEKFFCDALVETGCLEDDNDDFLESTHYYSGGLDRDNPRVEIKVIPL